MLTRFAPSPTGYLHLGHAGAAKCVWQVAGAAGGQVLLRIEDIDQTRCKPEFEEAIYEDLRWLGFDWPEPVRRQSDHFAEYARVLQDLQARGLIYRCFKTRKEVMAEMLRAPHGPEPAYKGAPLSPDEEAARMEAGEAFAWRLSLDRAKAALGDTYEMLGFIETASGAETFIKARPDLHGDVVLARKDTPASYHLAACHDDALQGVTHIVRGEDLAASTHIHVLLQALMGWQGPIYHHHALLRDATGKRFAKRDQSVTIRALRADGALSADILARASLI